MNNYHFFDDRLSLDSKGLLDTMLMLPDDWKFTEQGLSTITGAGKTVIKTCLKQLEKYGYLIRRQLWDAHGRPSGAEYLIFEDSAQNTEYLKSAGSNSNTDPTNA